MARSIAGSPASDAKPVDTSPAHSPATRPHSSRFLSTARRLVAGEAEEMPAVVHPLVEHVPRRQRRRALLDTDRVQQREQREREQRPRPDVIKRDGGRMECPGQRRTRGGDVRHGEPPGDDASPTTVVSEGPKSWLPGPEGPGHSGATAPDSHRLPRTNARGGECNRRPSGVHRRQVPRGMVGPVRGVLIVVGCALVIAPTADARPSRLEGVANGCYTAAPLSGRFFFKATGLGTFMPSDTDGKLLVSGDDGSTGRSDAPGPAAEWAPRRQRHGRVLLRSTATGRAVLVRLRRASGCRPYPEAE